MPNHRQGPSGPNIPLSIDRLEQLRSHVAEGYALSRGDQRELVESHLRVTEQRTRLYKELQQARASGAYVTVDTHSVEEFIHSHVRSLMKGEVKHLARLLTGLTSFRVVQEVFVKDLHKEYSEPALSELETILVQAERLKTERAEQPKAHDAVLDVLVDLVLRLAKGVGKS